MKFRLNIDNTAAFIGFSYLIISLNPFFLWILPSEPFYLLLVLVTFAIFFLLYVNKKITITIDRILISILILFFSIYLTLPLNRELYIFKLVQFLPFVLIVFFPREVLFKVFNIFRSILIVTSLFSIAIFFLLLLGCDPPYFKIPGFTLVMEAGFHFYKLYGIVVSSTNTVYQLAGLTISRICGPFQEPGHFAIYIGFILSIEKVLYNRLSKILIFAGILTFSPAFIIILLFILLHETLIEKKFQLLFYMLIFSGLLSILIASNKSLQQAVYFVTLGRRHIELGADEITFFNKRSQSYTIHAYNDFLNSKQIYTGLGVDKLRKYGVLSDYRGFIFKYGLIGIFLSSIIIFGIFHTIAHKNIFLFLLITVLIFAHRSWMFESPYIYFLLFIVSKICDSSRLKI